MRPGGFDRPANQPGRHEGPRRVVDQKQIARRGRRLKGV